MRVGGGLLFLIALLSIGDCASDGRAASGTTIEAAIKQLTREARRFQTAPLGLPGEPDFARRFEGTIEADDLDRALRRRTHRNPFIDAYVRWQLTSFADDSQALQELDEQSFGAFMRHAPAMVANPRADHSKAVSEQEDEFLVAGICDEDSQGITIRGAKMLGTGAVLADELLITTGQPLRPGEEMYAFTAAVPLAAKGLKILPRKSYEAMAVSQLLKMAAWLATLVSSPLGLSHSRPLELP